MNQHIMLMVEDIHKNWRSGAYPLYSFFNECITFSIQLFDITSFNQITEGIITLPNMRSTC